jgi:hypothetical protein
MKIIVLFLTAGLFTIASIGQAALIPIAATAASTQQGDRPSERVADGLSNGPSIYLVGGGDPGNAADYRLDATVNNNDFGQVTDWMTGNHTITNQWLSIDLGQDFAIDNLGFFNFAVDSGGNTDRGINQGDVYYRTDAAGPGLNTDLDGGPFNTTGWTLLGTPGTQTFSSSVSGSTANIPDVLSFGGVQARYIAFDVNTNLGDDGFVGIGEVMVFNQVAPVVPEPTTCFVLTGLALCIGLVGGRRRQR